MIARIFMTALLLTLPLVGSALALTREEIRDRVFMTVQTAGATQASIALSQAASRIAAGSPELAALLRERQDLSDVLQSSAAALTDQGNKIGAAAETEFKRLRELIAASQSRIAEIDATLDRDFPEFRELTRPVPVSLPEVQKLLKPDEALILTFTDFDFFYAFAISPTTADWVQVAITRTELDARVTDLRRQLSVTEANRSAVALKQPEARGDSFDRQAAHQLYLDLFQPLEPVFAPARHIMFVTDGPLTALPPAVLVTQPPTGADDDPVALRATHWLLADHALTTLPSVPALRALRRIADVQLVRRPDLAFVGFGDPELGYRSSGEEQLALADTGVAATISRGVYEDIAKVADLAPLPNTAKELRKLAATMGVGEEALFLGARATEANVKAADLSEASVVAFATHGLLSEGLPGLTEPALVFTPPASPDAVDDALLTASEAASLKLTADLVILSACDTAGSDGRPGAEGLSGLARAFIYAGARAILVSHWPVDDFAASALTTGMLGRMYGPDHLSRSAALQQSALALMNDPTNARYAHPRYWAPFVVVGEGG